MGRFCELYVINQAQSSLIVGFYKGWSVICLYKLKAHLKTTDDIKLCINAYWIILIALFYYLITT